MSHARPSRPVNRHNLLEQIDGIKTPQPGTLTDERVLF